MLYCRKCTVLYGNVLFFRSKLTVLFSFRLFSSMCKNMFMFCTIIHVVHVVLQNMNFDKWCVLHWINLYFSICSTLLYNNFNLQNDGVRDWNFEFPYSCFARVLEKIIIVGDLSEIHRRPTLWTETHGRPTNLIGNLDILHQRPIWNRHAPSETNMTDRQPIIDRHVWSKTHHETDMSD